MDKTVVYIRDSKGLEIELTFYKNGLAQVTLPTKQVTLPPDTALSLIRKYTGLMDYVIDITK